MLELDFSVKLGHFQICCTKMRAVKKTHLILRPQIKHVGAWEIFSTFRGVSPENEWNLA